MICKDTGVGDVVAIIVTRTAYHVGAWNGHPAEENGKLREAIRYTVRVRAEALDEFVSLRAPIYDDIFNDPEKIMGTWESQRLDTGGNVEIPVSATSGRGAALLRFGGRLAGICKPNAVPPAHMVKELEIFAREQIKLTDEDIRTVVDEFVTPLAVTRIVELVPTEENGGPLTHLVFDAIAAGAYKERRGLLPRAAFNR